MNNKEIKSILFICPDRIGDTVRATFFPRVFRKFFPDAFVAFMCTAPSDVILKANPFIDKVYVMPHASMREKCSDKTSILRISFPVFNLLNSIKQQSFDMIINPYSDFGGITIQYARPRFAVGRIMRENTLFQEKGKFSAEFFYTMLNRDNLREKRQARFVRLYADVLKDININLADEDLAPQLFLRESDRIFATRFIEKAFQNKRPIIGFQPGAFAKSKCWPLDNYLSLAKTILSETNCNILINGSEFEKRSFADKFISLDPLRVATPPVNTDILQSAAIISHCCHFVANDTGPLHIAAAFEISLTAIFGHKATLPVQSFPWGSDVSVFDSANIKDIDLEKVTDRVISWCSQNIHST